MKKKLWPSKDPRDLTRDQLEVLVWSIMHDFWLDSADELDSDDESAAFWNDDKAIFYEDAVIKIAKRMKQLGLMPSKIGAKRRRHARSA